MKRTLDSTAILLAFSHLYPDATITTREADGIFIVDVDHENDAIAFYTNDHHLTDDRAVFTIYDESDDELDHATSIEDFDYMQIRIAC